MILVKPRARPNSCKPLWHQFNAEHGVWLSQQADGWLWLSGAGGLTAAWQSHSVDTQHYGTNGIKLMAQDQPTVGSLADFDGLPTKLRRQHPGRCRFNVYYHNGRRRLSYRLDHNQLLLDYTADNRQLKFSHLSNCLPIWKQGVVGSWLHDYTSWFAQVVALPQQPGMPTLGLLRFLEAYRAQLTRSFLQTSYQQLLAQFKRNLTTAKTLVSATNLQEYALVADEFSWWLAHSEAVRKLLELGAQLGLADKADYQLVLSHLRRPKPGQPDLVSNQLAWFSNFLESGNSVDTSKPRWPLKSWDDIINCFMASKSVNM